MNSVKAIFIYSPSPSIFLHIVLQSFLPCSQVYLNLEGAQGCSLDTISFSASTLCKKIMYSPANSIPENPWWRIWLQLAKKRDSVFTGQSSRDKLLKCIKSTIRIRLRFDVTGIIKCSFEDAAPWVKHTKADVIDTVRHVELILNQEIHSPPSTLIYQYYLLPGFCLGQQINLQIKNDQAGTKQ